MKQNTTDRDDLLDDHQKLNPSDHARSQDQNILTEEAIPGENMTAGDLVSEFISLFVIFLIALGNQWQRFLISYANGVGTKKMDETTEIAYYYREYWKQYYGILAGLAFTFTFAVFGIFGGVTSDQIDRKAIIIVCSLCWSGCTLISGIIPSFWVFFLMRVLLGFFQAFMNPAAYSLITDYFPQKWRTRATSIYNVAIYFGGGMASLSGIIIEGPGWRFCYTIVACIGLGSSVIGIFFMRSPKRGRWEVKKPQQAVMGETTGKKLTTCQKFLAAMREIFSNPTCRWCAIGGFFRFFGGFSIAFFLPKYFGLIWPGDDLKLAYSITNAVVVSFCGFCSAIIGGWCGDYFESKGILMTKAYICIASGTLGSLFFTLCTMVQIQTSAGFAFSISMLAFEYLSAENWIAPAITMLMGTISTENKGFGVSAYLFFCSLGGTIATAIAQPLFTYYDVDHNHGRSGSILTVLVLISYLGSIPFFFLAGRSYTAYKEAERAENERKQNQGF